MQNIFVDIFTGKYADRVNAIQAISIFESFSELLPAGERGDNVIARLVDRLIEVDLLSRASEVLEKQIKHRLKGGNKLLAQLQQARVLLLDQKPQAALNIILGLDKEIIKSGKEYAEEAQVLRARALSKLDKSQQALNVVNRLSENDRVLALKSDIAWQNADWTIAADALEKRLNLREIDTSAEPTDKDVILILNLAIAYKLSSLDEKLESLKQNYQSYMVSSPQHKLFQIVTRKPEEARINDRDEILSFVAEVDLFQDVLNDF